MKDFFNLKNILNLALGLVISLGCLYFVFSKIDFSQVVTYIWHCNLFYFVLAFLISILSHIIRAYRYQLILIPSIGKKIALSNIFATIMLGYSINMLIPRAGELGRTVLLSKAEKTSISILLPSLIVDRMLDILVLGFLAVSGLMFLPASITYHLPMLKSLSMSLLFLSLASFAALPFFPKIIGQLKKIEFFKRFNNIFDQILLGLKCFDQPALYPKILISTILMWLCYFLNYIAIAYCLNFIVNNFWLSYYCAYLAGSLSVLIPTPGSAGSFHLIVSETLSKITHLSLTQSLAFATLLHIDCFVFSTIFPSIICAVILFKNIKLTDDNKI